MNINIDPHIPTPSKNNTPPLNKNAWLRSLLSAASKSNPIRTLSNPSKPLTAPRAMMKTPGNPVVNANNNDINSVITTFIKSSL